MKKQIKLIFIIAMIAIIACAFVACDKDDKEKPFVDYVSQLTLDMDSDTNKMEVTVKNYIDGDTTHFDDPNKAISDTGTIKARYLAINTPESTGRIEEYGKIASRFTRSKLESATSIIIESNDSNWNTDSTGSRYLLWVWYKTADSESYRNLNVEILQNGLALASNTGGNRYGTIASAALQQAKEKKVNMYSGIRDTEVYSGEVIPVTLKELRTNLQIYDRTDENSLYNKKVAFEGIITKDNGNRSVYVESIEPDYETGLRYGITCFYGYDQNAYALSVLTVGNYVRISGYLQYYENGGTYQIADMTYKTMNPDDLSSIQRLDNKTYEPGYQFIDLKKLNNGSTIDVEIETDEEIEIKKVSYAELVMDTTTKIDGLTVKSVYTTQSGDNAGALTLSCVTSDGTEITIRTSVLRNGSTIITADEFKGKIINVKGVIDYYNGKYQIGVFSSYDITVVE